MKKIAIGLSLCSSLLACGPGESRSTLKEAWDYRNDPSLMGQDYERRLEALPKSGRMSGNAWADDYWASRKGGISYRWQTKEIAYPLRKALDLDRDAIAKLSPTEKFDLYRGDENWSLTRLERLRTKVMATIPGSSEYIPGFVIPGWEGLCHGWAPASILYKEPSAVTLKNADGQEIPFSASDIKALLTYNIHSAAPIDKRLVGARCEGSASNGSVSCRDANAATFHLILSNEIGRMKRSFIIDAYPSDQVWNHPVLGFSSQLGEVEPKVTPGAAPGTVYEVEVETRTSILVESTPHLEALGGDNQRYEQIKLYRYVLELNAKKEIIGGRWLNDEHPDFIWRQGLPNLAPQLQGLEAIYKASTGEDFPRAQTSTQSSVPSENGTSGWGDSPVGDGAVNSDDWTLGS